MVGVERKNERKSEDIANHFVNFNLGSRRTSKVSAGSLVRWAVLHRHWYWVHVGCPQSVCADHISLPLFNIITRESFSQRLVFPSFSPPTSFLIGSRLCLAIVVKQIEFQKSAPYCVRASPLLCTPTKFALSKSKKPSIRRYGHIARWNGKTRPADNYRSRTWGDMNGSEAPRECQAGDVKKRPIIIKADPPPQGQSPSVNDTSTSNNSGSNNSPPAQPAQTTNDAQAVHGA